MANAIQLAIETYAELMEMTIEQAKAHVSESKEAQEIIFKLAFASA